MHVGREQPETVVLDAEDAAGLGHAALAQDQRLPALGQGPADDGPLLEGDAQPAHPTTSSVRRRQASVSPASRSTSTQNAAAGNDALYHYVGHLSPFGDRSIR